MKRNGLNILNIELIGDVDMKTGSERGVVLDITRTDELSLQPSIVVKGGLFTNTCHLYLFCPMRGSGLDSHPKISLCNELCRLMAIV